MEKRTFFTALHCASLRFTSLCLGLAMVLYMGLTGCQKETAEPTPNSSTNVDHKMATSVDQGNGNSASNAPLFATNDISSQASLSSLPSCCNCTITVTNLSNVYTTVVTINPDGPFPGFGCGNPYINFQQPLPPLGSWTEPGKAFSAGFDGLGNIFGMNASNFGINAENDCVSLRVIINCGGNTYDQTISAEPNLDTNCRYHLAKFGVDAEGNPETCNLEPINLSCKCRNNPNDCKIYCQGIGIGGGGS